MKRSTAIVVRRYKRIAAYADEDNVKKVQAIVEKSRQRSARASLPLD